MIAQRIFAALEYEKDNSALLQRVRKLAEAAARSEQNPGPAPRVCLFIADYRDALERSYMFDSKALAEAKKGFLGTRRKWLQQQAEPLEKAGIQVEVRVTWEKPRYLAILEHATEWQADIIMKATHHRGVLERTFLAPGDWFLIRKSTVPLWLVRDYTWNSHLGIAACIDPLPEGESGRDIRLLDTAHQLAVSLPAELHVIHALEPVPTGILPEFMLEESEAVREDVRSSHQRALERLTRDRVETSTRMHFEDGPAETVIPDVVAREGIDLVVIAAVARSGLERLLIGSTAEQLLDQISGDLLIIR